MGREVARRTGIGRGSAGAVMRMEGTEKRSAIEPKTATVALSSAEGSSWRCVRVRWAVPDKSN